MAPVCISRRASEAMIARISLLAGLAMVLFAHPAVAQSLVLDRSQTLEQILANCDRTTGLPFGVTAHPQTEPRRKIVINPDWLRLPTSIEVADAYPRHVDSDVPARATLQCQVGVDGRLHDCSAVTETPHGRGVGEAAIKLSREMRFVPKRIDCEPVDGGLVNIPVIFR